MTKALATLCAVVALSLPVPAEAILDVGDCIEKLPVTVEVKRGDTLISLARANYGGDSSRYRDIALEIARHNGIRNPDLIRVGQVLELPDKTYERWRPLSVADPPMFGSYCSIRDTP
ncbi:LysM peptidoglycan-binding domain-containing protein [Candidatus Woesearchaeota archaeon]|nr:LysM peptidoglycan-binding domain-containing protein [Candidatus Woesearchaeota archaeon]